MNCEADPDAIDSKRDIIKNRNSTLPPELLGYAEVPSYDYQVFFVAFPPFGSLGIIRVKSFSLHFYLSAYMPWYISRKKT